MLDLVRPTGLDYITLGQIFCRLLILHQVLEQTHRSLNRLVRSEKDLKRCTDIVEVGAKSSLMLSSKFNYRGELTIDDYDE